VATRRPAFRLLSVLVATTATLTLGPALVSAAPAPRDPGGRAAIEAARRELVALEHRMDDAIEDYDLAKVQLAAAKRKAAAAQGRVQRTQAKLATLQAAIGELAAAAYRNGGADPLVQLVNAGSPEGYLDTTTSLEQIARGQDQQLRAIKNTRRDMRDQETAARQLLAEAARLEKHVTSVRADIEADVERAERLLGILETKEARRVRLEAEARARAAALRREAAARASRSRRAVATYSGPASGRAAVAVRAAYEQLGKPYRWGAAGPNAFDCSGLMMWSWGKAGVSLPHSSRAQYGMGMHVSQSELRPGDLVFFGHPIHHVGMYVGGGQYIHAPHTGDVVRIASIYRGGWAGATRI
jgi:cell wall-associated NlpC family hydrolase